MQARGEGGGKQVAGPQVQLQGLREGMPLALGGLPQPSAPLTALPGAAPQLEPDTQPASGMPAAPSSAHCCYMCLGVCVWYMVYVYVYVYVCMCMCMAYVSSAVPVLVILQKQQ